MSLNRNFNVIIFIFVIVITAQVALANNLFRRYSDPARQPSEVSMRHPLSDIPAPPPPVIQANDLITVIIEERASGSGSGTSSTSKEAGLDFSVDDWFHIRKGWKTAIPSTLPNAQADASYEFSGSGRNTKESSLQARVKVMVKQVYPNGNLLVEGRSQTTIGDETNMIIISGIVQSEDVGQNKTIYSWDIYDLRVTYSGKGMISDATSPGWLTKFVNKFWPF